MKSHVECVQPHNLSVTARPAIGRQISLVWQQVRRWHRLYRQRQQLASLSDEMLKDIGLSRADVETEINRPFWDEPFRRG
jgi:uncharacterized protein YjiS (DUF1127 family)